MRARLYYMHQRYVVLLGAFFCHVLITIAITLRAYSGPGIDGPRKFQGDIKGRARLIPML